MNVKTLSKKLLSTVIGFTLVSYTPFFPSRSINLLTNQKSVVHASTVNSLPSNTKDGPILQAFDWSFDTIANELPNIAAAGYKSVQVSPVQGTKDPTTDPTKWWMLYQPTNESIGNAQLGSSTDFQTMCSKAKQYGVSIIVDVVMNHMAGDNDVLDPNVDPSFKDPSLYHNLGKFDDKVSNTRYDITQKDIGALPDLNTQSSAVQSKAITFLNQCIDEGASGFRFDSAKHIETNIGIDAGQSYAGNYWTNVLGNLHNKSNLFNYGEVIQDGTNDNVSAYESFMDVTACSYGYNLRSGIISGQLDSDSGMCGLTPSKSVNFVESHDNYEDGTSSGLSDLQIKLGWGIVASRAGSTPLFFDRPTGNIGSEGSSLWKDADIEAINAFHNAMAGQNEYIRLTNNNQTMLIDRGTIGTAIINDGYNTYINSPTNLANGTYTNQGTASCTLTVSNGKITGNIPANSVIVLYKSTAPVTNTVSWTPTNPTAGSKVTITYDASGRVLANSSSITAHWGYDGFKGVTDTTMTSLGNNKWQVTLTVPSTATSNLNICFTNGTSWDNNSTSNWSIPVSSTVTTSYSPHPGYKIDYDSSTLLKGNQFTIYYEGALANSSNLSIHWGYDGWTSPANVAMTKRLDGFWEGTLTIPSSASKLDFDFTDGTSWDNNSNNDWHLQLWSGSVPVQIIPAPQAGNQATVYYNGSLAASATSMTLHYGHNSFTSPTDAAMTKQSDGRWSATVTIPSGSYSFNMAFKNNAGTWDNNNSSNYNYACAE